MKIPIPSADFDPSSVVSHTVCSAKLVFAIKNTGVIAAPPNRRLLREWVAVDQFGNTYFLYRAVCVDGEEYDLGDRIKPSVLKANETTMGDLMDKYRAKAFYSFAKTDEAIRAMRAMRETSGKKFDLSKLLLPGADIAGLNGHGGN
jgi:hypothetical protein